MYVKISFIKLQINILNEKEFYIYIYICERTLFKLSIASTSIKRRPTLQCQTHSVLTSTRSITKGDRPSASVLFIFSLRITHDGRFFLGFCSPSSPFLPPLPPFGADFERSERERWGLGRLGDGSDPGDGAAAVLRGHWRRVGRLRPPLQAGGPRPFVR